MLMELAAELTRAVDGVDWQAERVEACSRQLVRASRQASMEELSAALDLLIQRLVAARLDDADGVAHVAAGSGKLVECGAPPRPLGELLLGRIPAVLDAARRFADRCFAAMGPE